MQFDAKKGQILRIDLLSHRLGLDTDAILVIQKVTKNDKGETSVANVAAVDDPADRNSRIGGEFDTSTDDPSHRLVVDQDGIYRVGVRDQFGDGRTDPRMIYRLIIREESPDFRLVAIPKLIKAANANQIPLVSPVVRKGETTLFQLLVDRRDGFAGEIDVQVEGLPEGVASPGTVIGASATSAWLVVVANENAARWSGPIKIVGRAKVGDKELVQSARGGTVVWATGNKTQEPAVFRAVRNTELAVIDGDTGPASIQVGDGKTLETCRGGKLEVPVKITRRHGFKGDMKLVATGVPGEIKPGDVTVKGDTGDGKVSLAITNKNAKPGRYSFFFISDVKFKYPRNQVAVKRAEEEQKQLVTAIAKLTEEVKQATAQVEAAKKGLAEASDDAKKTAEEQIKKTEALLKLMQDKAKLASDMKTQTDKRVGDLKKANAPKDLTVTVVSTPISLRIHGSPVSVTVDAVAVKQGDKAQLTVKIERKFGFDGPIDVVVTPPKGVTVANASIPKGQNEVKVEVAAAKDAPTGDHELKVELKTKFNNVDIGSSVTTNLSVGEQKP